MTLQKGKFISINDSDENVEKEELPNVFSIIKLHAQLDNINPLTPKSDQHLISHYAITHVSHIKVMRKRK